MPVSRSSARARNITPARIIALVAMCATAAASDRTADAFWAVAAAAGLWLAATTWSARGRLDDRRLAVIVAGDSAFVLMAIATTGHEHSDLRLAAVGLPAAWAVLYAARSILLAGPLALAAYLTVMSRGFTVDVWDRGTLVFALACSATVALAYVTAREGERTAARVAALEEQRRRLLAQALDAEDRERRRLSEALHDESLQLLLAAHQDLQELGATDGDPETLDAARQNLAHGLENLRGLVRAMHPLTVLTGDLETMLREVGLPLAQRGRFILDLDVDPVPEGDVDMLVVLIVRELLTNAATHARASRVTVAVRVDHEGRELTIRVRDDGVGISSERLADARARGHIGLAVAQERTRAADGQWTLDTAPGAGVEVRVALPLPVRPRAPGAAAAT